MYTIPRMMYSQVRNSGVKHVQQIGYLSSVSYIVTPDSVNLLGLFPNICTEVNEFPTDGKITITQKDYNLENIKEHAKNTINGEWRVILNEDFKYNFNGSDYHFRADDLTLWVYSFFENPSENVKVITSDNQVLEMPPNVFLDFKSSFQSFIKNAHQQRASKLQLIDSQTDIEETLNIHLER